MAQYSGTYMPLTPQGQHDWHAKPIKAVGNDALGYAYDEDGKVVAITDPSGETYRRRVA